MSENLVELQRMVQVNMLLQEQMKWGEYALLFLVLHREDLAAEAEAKTQELQIRIAGLMQSLKAEVKGVDVAGVVQEWSRQGTQ